MKTHLQVGNETACKITYKVNSTTDKALVTCENCLKPAGDGICPKCGKYPATRPKDHPCVCKVCNNAAVEANRMVHRKRELKDRRDRLRVMFLRLPSESQRAFRNKYHSVELIDDTDLLKAIKWILKGWK